MSNFNSTGKLLLRKIISLFLGILKFGDIEEVSKWKRMG